MRKLFLILFLALGTTLIIYPDYLLKQVKPYLKNKELRESITSIDSIEGSVKWKTSSDIGWHDLNINDVLANGDSIETNDNSNVILLFHSNWKIKIEPYSRVILEQGQITDQTLIILARGSYSVVEKGSQQNLLISLDGNIHSPGDSLSPRQPLTIKFGTPLNSTAPEAPTNSPIPATTSSAPAANGNLNEEGRLQTDYISATIKRYNLEFRRCYTHLQETSPNISGIVHLSFSIHNDGKVGDIQFPNSQISDQSFLACLKTVTERIQFQTFKGDPIEIDIPINFK